MDPYPHSDEDDDCLEFEGLDYMLDIFLDDVVSVRDFHANNGGNQSVDELVKALKYYIQNDAFYRPDE